MDAPSLAGKQLDSQVLYARQKQIRANQTITPAPIIIAAGLQSPENIGGVLRLADAAGCPRVLFVNEDTSQDRKRIQRAARSCDTLIAWKFLTPAQFLERCEMLLPLIALELTTASTNIFETRLPETCALMIGSERHGIPARLLDQCMRAIHIPMFGVNGSMNVTHALAIALFEWRRQHAPTRSLADGN